MKEKKRSIIEVFAALLVAAAVLMIAPAPVAANDREDAQAVVDRAKVTFSEFMHDQNYTWFHENLKNAKGLLIFPEVLKAGFILGGSGGTGVLVVRNEKTCDWSNPAFYTIGSVTLGLQIGGQSSELIMMVMSQKALDSLFESSVKLGGDTSVALGPYGVGAKSNVSADFISFAKTKGIYAGINLEGSVLHVRDSLNYAYYGEGVTPVEILVKRGASNAGTHDFLATLRRESVNERICPA
ncbi:MAG: lipid-binding SYLF domain-containing protein [Nitrospirae bacterium]|nr:lipid-binding SYLF domain-containing protein [Nitrospirota bacterium]